MHGIKVKVKNLLRQIILIAWKKKRQLILIFVGSHSKVKLTEEY